MRILFTYFTLIFLSTMGIVQAKSDVNDQLKMYIFDCGTIKVSNMDVFSSTGDYANTKETLTNSCFLIRHKKGDLLWDTGLPESLVNSEPMINGVFTLSMAKTLIEQLKQIDLTPQDIEFVSISHSHFDHVGQAPLFTAATWLVQEQEAKAMFSNEESKKMYAGFNHLTRKTFTGDLDVFGDGSVVILDMPGHTQGHTALQVILPKTGPVLLSGDLYHQTKSRTLKRVPRFNVDEPQTRESIDRFEKIVTKLGAKVIIQHEKKQMDTLIKSPNFLE